VSMFALHFVIVLSVSALIFIMLCDVLEKMARVREITLTKS
jgi:hypothetical protein